MDWYRDKEYVNSEIPFEMRAKMFTEAANFTRVRGDSATWLDVRLAWDKDAPISEVMRNRLYLVKRDREVHGAIEKKKRPDNTPY